MPHIHNHAVTCFAFIFILAWSTFGTGSVHCNNAGEPHHSPLVCKPVVSECSFLLNILSPKHVSCSSMRCQWRSSTDQAQRNFVRRSFAFTRAKAVHKPCSIQVCTVAFVDGQAVKFPPMRTALAQYGKTFTRLELSTVRVAAASADELSRASSGAHGQGGKLPQEFGARSSNTCRRRSNIAVAAIRRSKESKVSCPAVRRPREACVGGEQRLHGRHQVLARVLHAAPRSNSACCHAHACNAGLISADWNRTAAGPAEAAEGQRSPAVAQRPQQQQ